VVCPEHMDTLFKDGIHTKALTQTKHEILTQPQP
jgi:hypothetical protein